MKHSPHVSKKHVTKSQRKVFLTQHILIKVAEAKIPAFEGKCYRKIPRIDWMQKVTNAELHRRIDLTENLMQNIITRKLGLFGHICRMENDRKIKSVVFRRLEGTKKRGRPHKEWMDNIKNGVVHQ